MVEALVDLYADGLCVVVVGCRIHSQPSRISAAQSPGMGEPFLG